MNYKISLTRQKEPKQRFLYCGIKCNEGGNSFIKWQNYDKLYNCNFRNLFLEQEYFKY